MGARRAVRDAAFDAARAIDDAQMAVHPAFLRAAGRGKLGRDAAEVLADGAIDDMKCARDALVRVFDEASEIRSALPRSGFASFAENGAKEAIGMMEAACDPMRANSVPGIDQESYRAAAEAYSRVGAALSPAFDSVSAILAEVG